MRSTRMAVMLVTAVHAQSVSSQALLTQRPEQTDSDLSLHLSQQARQQEMLAKWDKSEPASLGLESMHAKHMADKMAQQKDLDKHKHRKMHHHVTYESPLKKPSLELDESKHYQQGKHYDLPGYGPVYWQLNLKDD